MGPQTYSDGKKYCGSITAVRPRQAYPKLYE